ncbi:hypothetical protein HAX54_014677 [Datura stramonium]|uniref:Uncharacterized protein n=1 Tax=Datura stramonium TaxID=4076 RepID=A0ABS8TQC8_DATST|nr:hypothetical protein [Datura stramonium]
MGSKDETILAQQLKMQFHGTRKGDLETIESYVNRLKSTANSLAAAIGNPVSDPDLVLQLLAGLPPQYLLLKNTISSRFPLPNFSEACSMLREYEISLLGQEKTSTQSSPNSGAAAKNNSNSNNSGKSTVEMIHDIANTVTAVAPIIRDFWNALGPWSGHSSGTPAAPGNKKHYNKRRTTKNNRGGGGPSTNNSRNPSRK